MTCQHLLEHLDENADENVRGWARWRFRLHLWCCRNCRRYVASYKATLRMAKRVLGGPPPAAPEDLVKAILSAERPR